jgi:peptide/nickel transport system substrate-binding protein
MKNASRFLCAAAVVAALLTLAGCGGGGASATSTPKPASSEPRYGGTVVLGAGGEPVNLTPWYESDSASNDVQQLVFAGLMKSNERLEVEPDVAAAPPEVSADGKIWTYRLRHGVKFHDGVELTAADVVYTFGVVKSPDYTGPRAGSVNTLERVEALDDYTVQFTLSEPDARWATRAVAKILPKHLLEQVPIAELGNYRQFSEHPIGAGPFKFGEWKRGQNLTLEAFDDYFEGRPYLDRVIFRYVANQSAAMLLLQTGDIDHMIVPAAEVDTAQQMPGVTLHHTLQLAYNYIGWNLRRPLFADKRVRQALAHAFNRQEYIDTMLGGRGQVANSPTSPLMAWAYTDDVPKFPYDPARAKALLAQAGWSPGPDGILQKDGQRFSFTMLYNEGSDTRRDLGVIAQQYLHEVGVEVKPAQMEWGAFLARISPPRFDFDAIILSWNLGLDPDPEAIWHSREIEKGLNNIAFSNARVDEIADRNIHVLDRAERAAMLKEAYRIIAEEQPYLFINYPERFVALRSDVRGFVQHPRLDTYGINKWWLDR